MVRKLFLEIFTTKKHRMEILETLTKILAKHTSKDLTLIEATMIRDIFIVGLQTINGGEKSE